MSINEYIYVVSSTPIPTAVFTDFEKLQEWLERQDLCFFKDWKVYRFELDMEHGLGQASFVELGSARFVRDGARQDKRQDERLQALDAKTAP